MGGTIVSTVLYVLLILVIVFAVVYEIVTDRKYKEIEKRGIKVKGHVEKIKNIRRQWFIKTGRCYAIVSFNNGAEQKTLRALSIVHDYDYSLGDTIDLLYLEEYPKLVIIEGVPSMTKTEIAFIIVVAVLLTIFIAYGINESYRDYKRNQEVQKMVNDFMKQLDKVE